eukprot:scaffold72502_cov31-Tisochrysis_lutea.AAC.3
MASLAPSTRSPLPVLCHELYAKMLSMLHEQPCGSSTLNQVLRAKISTGQPTPTSSIYSWPSRVRIRNLGRPAMAIVQATSMPVSGQPVLRGALASLLDERCSSSSALRGKARRSSAASSNAAQIPRIIRSREVSIGSTSVKVLHGPTKASSTGLAGHGGGALGGASGE